MALRLFAFAVLMQAVLAARATADETSPCGWSYVCADPNSPIGSGCMPFYSSSYAACPGSAGGTALNASCLVTFTKTILNPLTTQVAVTFNASWLGYDGIMLDGVAMLTETDGNRPFGCGTHQTSRTYNISPGWHTVGFRTQTDSAYPGGYFFGSISGIPPMPVGARRSAWGTLKIRYH
jgi:hypothetical protein